MPSIFLSPGIFLEELDLSQTIATVASSSAAIVGASNKGKSDDRVLVTTARQFLDEFGDPDISVSTTHYHALAYLEDGNQLYVTRVHNGALFAGVVINEDGSAADSEVLSGGEVDPENFDFSGFADNLFAVFADNEGVWGNDIRVRVTNVDEATFVFDIEVYELQNGTYVLVETHTVSRKMQLDGFRKQQYLETVINDNSAFIRVRDNTANADTLLPQHTVTVEVLGTGDAGTFTFAGTFVETPIQRDSVSITDTIETFADDGAGNLIGSAGGTGTINYETGVFSVTFDVEVPNAQDILADYFSVTVANMTLGNDGSAITDSDLIAGWDLYINPDDVDVRILINGGYSSVNVQAKIRDICESRLDCMGILDLPSAQSAASDALFWRRNTQNFNSSYVALYAQEYEIFDSFNDQILTIPPSGHVAGIYARTDRLASPANAPAGIRRGLLKVRTITPRYTQGERDLLYPAQINFARVIPGFGNPLWGQKTEQSIESALSRVASRRILIVLEKSISIAQLNTVFENNNEFTRLQVQQSIAQFLQTLKNNRDLIDFLVQCDEDNNDGAVIDAFELHIDVFLKLQRAAEFIRLRAIITRTDASFEELITQGV